MNDGRTIEAKTSDLHVPGTTPTQRQRGSDQGSPSAAPSRQTNHSDSNPHGGAVSASPEQPRQASAEPADKQPCPSRDRTRRYRDRKLLGITIIRAQVDRQMVDWLVSNGWLMPCDAENKKEIRRALDHFLYSLPRSQRKAFRIAAIPSRG